MKKTDIIIGLDGGATSTRSVITNTEGIVLARGAAGPSNQGFGEARKKQLQKALKKCLLPALKFLEQGAAVKSICLGMTGVSVGNSSDLIKNITQEYLGPKRIKVTGDMEIAFMGASLEEIGILIYAGTGVNCYGRDETGKVGKVSGWGYIIDDEGGGYDIGRKALQAVFRAHDSRGKKTLLTGSILSFFSCGSEKELCQKIYCDKGTPRSKIGRLSHLVSKAAAKGDEVAIQILNRAGRELALCVHALYNRLTYTDILQIYPCGGVFKAGSLILEPFREEISREISSYEINDPYLTPDCGALLIAAREADIKIDSNFINNLKKTYN